MPPAGLVRRRAEQSSPSIVLPGVCRPFFTPFEERSTISAHFTQFILHWGLCVWWCLAPPALELQLELGMVTTSATTHCTSGSSSTLPPTSPPCWRGGGRSWRGAPRGRGRGRSWPPSSAPSTQPCSTTWEPRAEEDEVLVVEAMEE